MARQSPPLISGESIVKNRLSFDTAFCDVMLCLVRRSAVYG